MAYLEFYRSGDPLLSYRWEDGLVKLGRASDCQILLNDPSISRLHCIFRYKDQKACVEDSSSNGLRLSDGRPVQGLFYLEDQQELFLTRALSFRFLKSPSFPREKTLIAERQQTLLLQASADASEIERLEASLEWDDPEQGPVRRRIDHHGVSVGRHPSNDIRFDSPYVSQFHFSIEWRDREFFIRDLGSANGLSVDGEKTLSKSLSDNQEITFGEIKILFRQRKEEINLEPKPEGRFFDLVSKNPKMRRVFALTEVIAPLETPVFLHGETGTGKELLAKAIHQLSPRYAKNFLALNCAALPKELVESELFGHEKGAFTSAGSTRIGAFEAAHGGTLFLDEVAELDLPIQAKLLRVLESGEFQRLGSHQRLRSSVRLISATHVDLAKRVKEGLFREDLYYRLHVLPLSIPPLRDRLDDLEVLIAELCEKLNIRIPISPDALEMLKLYDYPGNVRELKNILSRASVEQKLSRSQQCAAPETLDYMHFRFLPGLEKYKPVHSEEERQEKARLLDCLQKHDFHQSKAAKELGLAVSSLHDKMKRFGIHSSNS